MPREGRMIRERIISLFMEMRRSRVLYFLNIAQKFFGDITKKS
jgi:hypothetical protein